MLWPYTSTRTGSSMFADALPARTDANSRLASSRPLSMPVLLCWRTSLMVAMAVWMRSADESADRLAPHGAEHGTGLVDVEHDQRQRVLLAQRDRRLVHDAQLVQDDVAVADRGIERRRGVLLRVGRVDPVDARRLHDDVRLDLDGPQHGGRV